MTIFILKTIFGVHHWQLSFDANSLLRWQLTECFSPMASGNRSYLYLEWRLRIISYILRFLWSFLNFFRRVKNCLSISLYFPSPHATKAEAKKKQRNAHNGTYNSSSTIASWLSCSLSRKRKLFNWTYYFCCYISIWVGVILLLLVIASIHAWATFYPIFTDSRTIIYTTYLSFVLVAISSDPAKFSILPALGFYFFIIDQAA